MNLKDSLLESTMLALQGKLELKESVDISVQDDGSTFVETDDATVVVQEKQPVTDIIPEEEESEEVVEVPVEGTETIIPEEEISEEQVEEIVADEPTVDEIVDEEELTEGKEIKTETKLVYTYEVYVEGEQPTMFTDDTSVNDAKKQYIEDYDGQGHDISEVKVHYFDEPVVTEGKEIKTEEVEITVDEDKVEVTTNEGEEVEVKDETPEEEVTEEPIEEETPEEEELEEASANLNIGANVDVPDSIVDAAAGLLLASEEDKKEESCDCGECKDCKEKKEEIAPLVAGAIGAGVGALAHSILSKDENKEVVEENVDARPHETAVVNYLEGLGYTLDAGEGAVITDLLGFMSDDDIKRFAEIYEYDIFNEDGNLKKEECKEVEECVEESKKFSSKSFNEALTNFYKGKYKNVESFQIEKVGAKADALKIEGKLVNVDGIEKSICMEMKKVQEGKSFTRYQLINTTGLLKESKDNFTLKMMTFTNKDNVLECKYLVQR